MDPVRFRRLMDLLGDALELHAGERHAWLTAQCGDDHALLEEALSLLDQEADGVLSLTQRVAGGVLRASADAAGTDTVADRNRAGQRAGAYRLLEVLAHGGMGTVWLAERADDQYRARVAIKFVRGALAAPALERRFRAERQILADLNHPNIARLLDGGAADDGTPFLVMEYLDGQPIDAWCEANRLGIDDRIRLFLEVCRAVAYAHRSRVIHGDIKPSNILVTADGTPKLLDFGVAQLLEEAASGSATMTMLTPASVTMTMRAMTPAYASPEQLLGQPVTRASDVYSLGIVLYELLAGRPPFDLRGATPATAERLVCGTAPPAPSAAAAERNAAWSRTLDGPLDDIILHTLRKEPEGRPPSVDALTTRLEQYLALSPGDRRTLALRGRLRRRLMSTPAVAAAAFVLVSAVAFTVTPAPTEIARLDGFEHIVTPPASAASLLPYHVLAGDVNGDGRGDLIGNHTASGINLTYVAFGNTDGTFTFAPVVAHDADPPEGWAHYAAIAGDFDGDGTTDLAWHGTGRGEPNRLYVAFSTGDGSFRFTPPETFGPSGWASGWRALVGDFDDDGRDDIVFSFLGRENIVYLVRSNGDGTFTSPGRITHPARTWRGYRAFLADVDGDARADIIWNDVPTFSNRTYVARSRGDRLDLLGWQDHPAGQSDSTFWATYETHTGDIDGDGRTDMVWTAVTGDTIHVQRALGDAAAQFQYLPLLAMPIPTPVERSARAPVFHLADFNGDGRADLLYQDADADATVWIALATAQGAFDVPAGYVTPAAAAGMNLLPLDVDGDGRTDIVRLPLSGAGSVHTALARPSTPVIGPLHAAGRAVFGRFLRIRG